MSPSLTPRQTEVIQLLAGGWQHKQISDYLGISVSSVKKRAKAAFGKLGAQTPAQAVYNFYCNGRTVKMELALPIQPPNRGRPLDTYRDSTIAAS